MTGPLRIGTRGSQLALWQANEVARQLLAAGHPTEVVTIRTTGDKRQDVSLAAIGGKGLFIKELEEALERGTVDLAVHSLKDVPSIVSERYALAAFLERADPRDAWIQPEGTPIAEMPAGTSIATSAPRRRAQIRGRYPHLRIEEIRGNVDTRINKVRSGQFGAAILASAGLKRLGREGEITSFFSIDELVPAAGQGIVAIETRAGDERARSAAESINHEPSAIAARCERGVLQRFETRLDCYSAVAVHATVAAEITIRAFFADPQGERSIRLLRSGRGPKEAIDTVVEGLKQQGVEELLELTARLSPGKEAD